MKKFLKFGIELEGFVKKWDDGLFYKIADINEDLPRDSHPYTFEIRTKPYINIQEMLIG